MSGILIRDTVYIVRVLAGVFDAEADYITMATAAMATSRVRDATRLVAPDSFFLRSTKSLHLSFVQHLPHLCTCTSPPSLLSLFDLFNFCVQKPATIFQQAATDERYYAYTF